MTAHYAPSTTRLESPVYGGRVPTAVGGGPTSRQSHTYTSATQSKSPIAGGLWGPPDARRRRRRRLKAAKRTYFPRPPLPVHSSLLVMASLAAWRLVRPLSPPRPHPPRGCGATSGASSLVASEATVCPAYLAR